VKIVLKDGPLNGDTDPKVGEFCGIYRRSAKGPNARYKDSGTTDAQGRRIFEHWPPKPGEPEPTEGVHDA
jgi:hypothetical protein